MDENNLADQQNQPLSSVAPPTSNPTPPTPSSPTASPATPAPVQPSTPETPAPEPTMITTDALDKEAAEAPKSTISKEEPNINSGQLSPIESLIVGEDALEPESDAAAPVVPPLTVVSDSASLGDSQPNLNNAPVPAVPTQSPTQPTPTAPAQSAALQSPVVPTSQATQSSAQAPTSPIMSQTTPTKKPPVGLIIGIVSGIVALIVAIILIIALSSKHMIDADTLKSRISQLNFEDLECDGSSHQNGEYVFCDNYDFSGNRIEVHFLYAKDKEIFKEAMDSGNFTEYLDQNLKYKFTQDCDNDNECTTYINVESSFIQIDASRSDTDKIVKAIGY